MGYAFVFVADETHQSADDLGFEGFGGAFFSLHQYFQQNYGFEQNIAGFFFD